MELKDIKTPHFTLEELVKSDTAQAKNIPNIPSVGVLRNLCQLVEELLEPARAQLGAPIIVTSGYRSVALNQAVGGVNNSQHIKGQAADIVCTRPADKRKLFEILKTMDYDQLLWETNSAGTQWIHVSYVSPDRNRHILNENYKTK